MKFLVMEKEYLILGEKIMKNEIEKCPKCDSIFIQYNNATGQCYCLEKICQHKWYQKLDYDSIENNYLRCSIHNKESLK